MNKLALLEARLTRLEKNIKLQRITIALLLSSVIFACATMESTPSETGIIETEALHIVNSDGTKVAELGHNGLQLYDDQRRSRLSLRHNDEETGLFILDKVGDSRIGIAQFAHGGGGVALHGPGLKGAAVLYYKKSGSLSFYAADGAVLQRLP